MGWKAVSDHYRIDFIVSRSGDDIHVGVPYVPDQVVVKPDGRVEVTIESNSQKMARVVKEMREDRAKLVSLIEATDTFETSIPVYRDLDGQIVQHLCEEIGWPNVTHDGHIMYENQFFADPKDAVEHGLSESRAMIEYLKRDVVRIENQLLEAKADLARGESNLASYEAMAAGSPHVHGPDCGCKTAG